MEKAKIFFDHLVFSLIVALVAFAVLTPILGGVITDFSVIDHTWVAVGIWIALSGGVALLLTILTVRRRAPDRIEFTRRRH